MKLLVSWSLALLVAAIPARFNAKSERAGPPVGISLEQRKVLESKALTVRDGGAAIMRVWFRKAIPVQAPPPGEKRDATYRDIAEGAFIGVLELPKVLVDFRRQRLPLGVYTMRYAVQPDIGEHTDTSPHREFLLLTAVADDLGTERMEPQRLIALSRKINEGTHPAVILLWPITGRDAAGSIIDEGKDVLAVAVRRTGDASGRKTPLGFGITVSGVRKQ